VRRFVLPLSAALAATTLPRGAAAAPPWVERPLTLPAGDFAFDVGTGVVLPPPTGRVELGIRTGLRFGDDFERNEQPDAYARLFDLQTFDTGAGAVANPEVRLRGELVRGEVGELGLEGRVVLPFALGTGVGLEFGMPVALHAGERVRFDTGAYVPVIVEPRGGATARLGIPLEVWIQATSRFWIGPVSELSFDDAGAHFGLGLGLGYQITRGIDFKAMGLFPDVTRDGTFGIGAGLQFRIE
jgi:hypothetical protein